MPDLALDLRYLRFAFAAAEQGSFRRAAAELGVPYSSISRRVQALEDRLGIAIFERRTSGVRVTPAGGRFLREAAQGVEQLNRAVHAAAMVRTAHRGELQVGILASLSSGFLRTMLQTYAAQHAGVRITLQVATPEEQIGSIVSGRLDVAFITGTPRVPGCHTLPLWTERIHLALPDGHNLSRRPSVCWADIARERFIVTASGPGPEIASYIIKRAADLSFQPDIHAHDIGRDDLMHLVAMGFGLTLTSTSMTGTAYPGLALRPFSERTEILPASALWATTNKNPALKRLLQSARQLTLQRGQAGVDTGPIAHEPRPARREPTVLTGNGASRSGVRG